MLRLRRVHIRRFRSVAPDTTLVFGPGQVFLLGTNGSGKTTLLDLLARLVSCELAPLREEEAPVDIEWELEREVADVPWVAGHHRLELRLRVEPGSKASSGGTNGAALGVPLPRSAPRWWFEGVHTLPAPEKHAVIGEDGTRVLQDWQAERPAPTLRFAYAWDAAPTFDPPLVPRTRGEDGPPPSPFDSNFLLGLAVDLLDRIQEDLDHPDLLHQRKRGLLFVVNAVREPAARFDEALGMFQAIVGGPEPQVPVAQVEWTDAGFRPRFFPQRLDPTRMQTAGEIIARPADPSPEDGPTPDLLREMAEILGAEAVTLRPRLLEEDAEGHATWRGFDLFVTWPGGSKHRHDQLSFGQKRLLAFMWYAAVHAEVPLFTDELTNGLHASWVRAIVDRLDGRQALHALQNPLLLDMSGPGPEEAIPGRFVLCSAVAGEKGREWRWRNPTAEEAHRLRRAWKAGFQQLSEVLFSEGLW